MNTQPDLGLAELLARLRWFINLRWLAAAAVAVLAVALRLLGVEVQVVPLLAVAVAIAAYNLLFWLHARSLPQRANWPVGAVASANLQIGLDLVALTVLLHYVAGVENPFYLYYAFHVIIASILLSAWATYLHTTLAVTLFTGLVALEYWGVLPHVHVPGLLPSPAYRHGLYVLAVLAAFSSTLYLAAFVATSIVGTLRARQREVIALSRTLERREADLRSAYDRLQETERAKSEYMRRVSHDLRSPLGAAQSMLAVVLQNLAGPLPEPARAMLQRVAQRQREMLAVVNDLLALSRAREVRMEGVRRPVPLADLAARVAAEFQAQAESKGLDLSTSIPPDLPAVWGDPDGLQEMLSNLISNAVKYTPPGGRVRVELARADDAVRLQVSDTGIGIEQEEIPRIFEEFYRTGRARELVREGTGLGLSIVKAVVEAHRGRIDVESAPGRGTTFTVTLPIGRGGGQERGPGSGEAAEERKLGSGEERKPGGGEGDERTRGTAGEEGTRGTVGMGGRPNHSVVQAYKH